MNKKQTRRNFITKASVAGTFALCSPIDFYAVRTTEDKSQKVVEVPIVVSTWKNFDANGAAWKKANEGENALDIVETGVKVAEANPDERTVGYGGRPDRDGKVTLDACIMDHELNCGAVAFLEHIKHPISVARLVMEKTPHVMLAGEGALGFALRNGFEKEDLLTEKSELEWKKWLEKSEYAPRINIESHDTIGMLALDKEGRMAGACTTSGTGFKMRGRVGDSPIIGAGLYVDGEVGGAVATGLGEAVIKTVGSFLVVELMRSGKTPQQACEIAIERIMKKFNNDRKMQVGFLALNNFGEIGAYSVRSGFNYTKYHRNENTLVDAKSFHGN